ncbi:MAG TPA: FG-GAP-like repeat-containing protein [Bryobacteraceae bacterium]|nr:FG-GAP-like repeat-containing protein [Bryobacteraceae bacterium]
MKIIGLPLAGVKKVGKAVTPQRTRMYYYLWVSGLDPKICYVDFKPSTQTLPAMVPATVGTAAQNGTAAALIVSADLNGDGILDEIVSNLDTEIDISLGNEDGSLQSPVSYDLRTEVSSIAVADVNGDGKPDVIVTGFGDTTSYVSVLLGNGDGTLQAPVNLSVGTFPQSVAIGDFNGDGKPDLAVAADDALYLLLGNGNGTFHAPVSLLSGTGLSVIAADFNGDGKLDLALGQFAQASGKGTVAVLMGNGNGTFQNPQSTDAGVGNADFLGFGDFNGDGKLDLAISHVGTASISIRPGNGDGTFRMGNTYSATNNPFYPGFSLLDLDGDGNLDFVVNDADTGVILNIFGNGDGTFDAPIYYSAPLVNPTAVSSVAAADFNSDGKPDLATSDGSIWLGNGSGQFTLGSAVVPSGTFLVAGDFNGDGKQDLATSSGVALGNGDGSFRNLVHYADSLTAGYIVAGDFNRDGKLDLAVAPGNPADLLTTAPSGPVSILLGNGDGSFHLSATYNGGSQPYAIAAGDFNGDGKLDLAIANYGAGGTLGSDAGGISILLGNGDGTFTAGASFQAGKYPAHLAAADLNGDGRSDLVIATTTNGTSGAIAVFLGNGDGTFRGQPLIPTTTTNFAQWVEVFDPNGDGKPDILESENNGVVGYFQGNGDGTFQAEISFPAGPNPLQLLRADFNGDGLPDLAVADYNFIAGGGGFVVLLNQPQTVQTTAITIQTNPAGLQFSLDGTSYSAPQTLNLSQDIHTISATTPQTAGTGTQYAFASWSDGGAPSHMITVGTAAASYTATFKIQYQLTTVASPVNGGSVSPLSGGFYDSGTVAPVSATPAAGFQFTSWTGPVANSSSAATTVTMSGPETVTASFSSVAGVTIQTNPSGLQFTVDGGSAQTAPQTLTLSTGTHTIAVATTQQVTTGTRYNFMSWNDGGAASHIITVGSTPSTYTATFGTQYLLTISASPANGGSVTPLSGGYYDAGTAVPISATAASGFVFANWTGTVASSSSASTTVTMAAPDTVTANFSALAGITIQTSPAGLQFSVDNGSPLTAPQVLTLSGGQHTIAVAQLQTGPSGTQYMFTNWSDDGAATHTITVTSAAATYLALFKTQFQLSISASPANGGTVSPSSGGYYDQGTAVPITATPAAGYQFTSWTGPVGASTNPATTVTMSQPRTVIANFALASFTLSQTSASLSAAGGTASVNVIASIGTASWTAVSNDNFITVTSGSSGTGNGTVNYTVAANTSANARAGTMTIAGQTFTVMQAGAGQVSPLRFVPLTPCRIMDTRGAAGTFGGPRMAGGSTRTVPIPKSGCGIPASASAYSLNITVVPPGPLTYLSIWPAGQTQPVVSTLNSFDGRIVANAAIVPAGSGGAINVFVSDASDVIIDINGYFAPPTMSGRLSFYSLPPCRVADTRNPTGPLGGPLMAGGSTRSFPIPSSSCGVPPTALAYSFNLTVVPRRPLGYLTTWPSGQPQPLVSTLNSPDGEVVANAAIVPSGSNGAISVFVTDDTDVIIDINGYFGPPDSPAAQSLYTVTPCRVADTRGGFDAPFGSPGLAANGSRSFPIPTSVCSGIPATAQAYSLNVTVVPNGPLNYLTTWPTGQMQPVVSTLNSPAGLVVANAAIVPSGTGGAISVFVTNPTNLILDINAYFAP